MPTRAELPTSGQLLRSTLIAAGVALILLITVVLPAEHGIDPTGIGRTLGLAEMGEIKTQLAEEAEADRRRDQAPPAPATPDQRSSLFDAVVARVLIGRASAQQPAPTDARSDEMTVTLEPGEGAEVKVSAKEGARVTYTWVVDGGVVNYETHGEPTNQPDQTHSYAKGRSVPGDEGVLTVAFDGNHGWFWRNRGSETVTVRLTTSGDYDALKRLM